MDSSMLLCSMRWQLAQSTTHLLISLRTYSNGWSRIKVAMFPSFTDGSTWWNSSARWSLKPHWEQHSVFLYSFNLSRLALRLIFFCFLQQDLQVRLLTLNWSKSCSSPQTRQVFIHMEYFHLECNYRSVNARVNQNLEVTQVEESIENMVVGLSCVLVPTHPFL